MELCRGCAMARRGKHRWDEELSERLQVEYEGAAYLPDGYLLAFDGNGCAVHTAILRDLKANSTLRCPLAAVNAKQKKG